MVKYSHNPYLFRKVMHDHLKYDGINDPEKLILDVAMIAPQAVFFDMKLINKIKKNNV